MNKSGKVLKTRRETQPWHTNIHTNKHANKHTNKHTNTKLTYGEKSTVQGIVMYCFIAPGIKEFRWLLFIRNGRGGGEKNGRPQSINASLDFTVWKRTWRDAKFGFVWSVDWLGPETLGCMYVYIYIYI